jgi:uroporphyrinogen-III decarboxylase
MNTPTLRDYFAVQALHKLMGKKHSSIRKTLMQAYEDQDAHDMAMGMIADTAYEWADAMLKARGE